MFKMALLFTEYGQNMWQPNMSVIRKHSIRDDIPLGGNFIVQIHKWSTFKKNCVCFIFIVKNSLQLYYFNSPDLPIKVTWVQSC